MPKHIRRGDEWAFFGALEGMLAPIPARPPPQVTFTVADADALARAIALVLVQEYALACWTKYSESHAARSAECTC